MVLLQDMGFLLAQWGQIFNIGQHCMYVSVQTTIKNGLTLAFLSLVVSNKTVGQITPVFVLKCNLYNFFMKEKQN